MRTITVNIDCKEETCGDCKLLDGNYCSCFGKELETRVVDGVNTDLYRLPECKREEIRKEAAAAFRKFAGSRIRDNPGVSDKDKSDMGLPIREP